LAISSNGCSASRNRATRSLPGPLGALHLTVTMSKAFTKETETEAEFDDELPALPAGIKNYITPDGFRRLEDEFAELQRSERPKIVETVAWAAGNGDRSENGDYIYGKRRLREIDRRLRFLRKRMEIAEVVDPARQKNHAQVYFGATVTYLTGHGEEKTVRIVGIDEARSELHEISWISPVAKALLKATEGDSVEVRTPKGSERLEILKVSY
jgi:transcription elongation factor GreB